MITERPAPAPPLAHEGLPLPERRKAMMTLLCATFMAVLDGSIANVALPTIARELHASPALSIWVINGFQVAVCCSVFAAAALGELLGYARVWRVGLAVFTVGSAACAFSPTLGILVASRVLQGFGAAMVMSIQPSVVRHIYPPKALGQGTGWIALTVASTSAAGPTFGGALLAVAPWPWLFLINVPIGIALIFIGRRTVPNSRQPANAKISIFRAPCSSR